MLQRHRGRRPGRGNWGNEKKNWGLNSPRRVEDMNEREERVTGVLIGRRREDEMRKGIKTWGEEQRSAREFGGKLSALTPGIRTGAERKGTRSTLITA